MINSTFLIIIGLFLGFFIKYDFLSMPYFTLISNIFLSIALVSNAQKISLDYLKKNIKKSMKIISFGFFFKTSLFALILFLLTKDLKSLILAPVLSQIDPISTFKNVKNKFISKKSQNLILFESNFDDPLSILIVFYLALPLILNIQTSIFNYFFGIILNFLIFFIVNFFIKKLKKDIFTKIIIILSIFFASIFNYFLFIALLGLFSKKVLEKELNNMMPIIYYFVFISLGLIASQYGLMIIYGLIAAFSLFFSRFFEIFLLFKSKKMNENFELIFSEEKGITSILIALSVSSQINIISLVLSSIIIINSLSFLALRFNKKLF